jgi:hypothetical protein
MRPAEDSGRGVVGKGVQVKPVELVQLGGRCEPLSVGHLPVVRTLPVAP